MLRFDYVNLYKLDRKSVISCRKHQNKHTRKSVDTRREMVEFTIFNHSTDLQHWPQSKWKAISLFNCYHPCVKYNLFSFLSTVSEFLAEALPGFTTWGSSSELSSFTGQRYLHFCHTIMSLIFCNFYYINGEKCNAKLVQSIHFSFIGLVWHRL